MNFKRMFPCVIAACLALSLFAIAVNAQSDNHQRQANNFTTTTTIEPDGAMRLETDPIIISRSTAPAILKTGLASNSLIRFDNLLLSAIDSRLGSRYVWGAAGPHVFDCSGFVWSSFKQIGADFYRGSARSYWARFAPAREDEKFKFGTLVFFNGLTHVGIVADEHGFYHASRHKGVVYQEWNKYYLSRVDGFRRVPMPAQFLASAE
jgi:cell wall-associated NlpC family hydrolase